MKSKFFKLKAKDIGKSTIMFFLTTIGGTAYKWFNNGYIPTDPNEIKTVLGSAGLASAAYLLKQLLTNSKDEFLKKETENTIK